MEDLNTGQRFSFLFFLKFNSFQNLTPEEFANIWQIERNVMKTMKF